MSSLKSLLKPRYGLIWLGLGLLWLMVQLPYRWQQRLGQFIGLILYVSGGKPKQVAATNLALCFPNLSQYQRNTLLKANFMAVGQGLLEAGFAWWASDKRLQGLLHIEGLAHLQAALAAGHGVIFASAHFTSLEIVGRLLAQQLDFAVMYRPQKNPVLDYLVRYYRQRYYKQVIARENLRGMIKTLKAKQIVWYTTDIDAGKRNSVFAPFFGIPAASLTATSRLAELTDAKVVPVFFYRRPDATGYDLVILPAVTDFPSADLAVDAQRINDITEQAIRQCPEQYLWQYKRFKTRPDDEPRFY